ncbi:hypothetical protein T12_744, partial [Trichinella patagoniensis]
MMDATSFQKKGLLRTQAKPLLCGSGRHRLACQS